MEIIQGDCIEEMRQMPAGSVDAIVTDPPYGLGFMGKQWDELPPGKEWAEACLRVLKAGGHLLAFGGTRTWHRLAVAIEDAGFEIRDSIAWMYGSGFPKSMDVSKAIDKAAGAEPIVTGYVTSRFTGTVGGQSREKQAREGYRPDGDKYPSESNVDDNGYKLIPQTRAATPEAEKWQGWGTALKPAFEPVVVARKPLSVDGKKVTVAGNVLAHGTGALNIDGCRIGTGDNLARPFGGGSQILHMRSMERGTVIGTDVAGRFPANVILDESQAAALDEQSGMTKAARTSGSDGRTQQTGIYGAGYIGQHDESNSYADSGGASRFFYVAKAPKKERPVVDGVAHPTVKPLALMRYLVRLVTPPGGTVLEPFAGSGTTVEAALLEGFDVIGIERDASYLPLIQARIDRVAEQAAKQPAEEALF